MCELGIERERADLPVQMWRHSALVSSKALGLSLCECASQMTNSWSTGTHLWHIACSSKLGRSLGKTPRKSKKHWELIHWGKSNTSHIFKSTWKGMVYAPALKSQTQPGEVVWHCGKCPGLMIRWSMTARSKAFGIPIVPLRNALNLQDAPEGLYYKSPWISRGL